jgi:hypothetical protein
MKWVAQVRWARLDPAQEPSQGGGFSLGLSSTSVNCRYWTGPRFPGSGSEQGALVGTKQTPHYQVFMGCHVKNHKFDLKGL